MSQRAMSTIHTRAMLISRSAAIFEKLNLSIVSLSMITKKNSREDTNVIKSQKYPTSLSGNIENEVRLLTAKSQSFI